MKKDVTTDKYTVAWFKLAECVARGEKERAFGMYRLLAHSIDNVALALQLEGDLLLSFEDSAAVHKYRDAAYEYYQRGDRAQAAALYEQIFALSVSTDDDIEALLVLYHDMGFFHKIDKLLARLASHCSSLERIQKLDAWIVRYGQVCSAAFKSSLYKNLLMRAFMLPTVPNSFINRYLYDVLGSLINDNKSIDLQQFLVIIQEKSPLWYRNALAFLEHNKVV